MVTTKSMFDRRSFGRFAGTFAAVGVATAVVQHSGLAQADAPDVDTAGARVGPDGMVAGFNAAARTRLDVLEMDAKLGTIAQGGLTFRAWIDKRLDRMESQRHVVHGLDKVEQSDKEWQDDTVDRLNTLDAGLPAALRYRFTTHLPLDTPTGDFGKVLRARIAAGACNGIFLYGNSRTPLGAWSAFDSITSTGGPVPILVSPKNVKDPAKLKAFTDYWAARPAWIPYVRVAFWQEFQGDFGGAGQPPISEWQESVNILADACDKIGLASMAHAETWNLFPTKPDGGAARLLEFLSPVIDRLGGGISWSLFVFTEKTGAGNDYVTWMNEFMAKNFPYTSYGVSAYGDAVPPSLPPDDPRRVARANRVDSTLGDMSVSKVSFGGYYALPQGPDITRNFWDGRVESKVSAALAHEIG